MIRVARLAVAALVLVTGAAAGAACASRDDAADRIVADGPEGRPAPSAPDTTASTPAPSAPPATAPSTTAPAVTGAVASAAPTSTTTAASTVPAPAAGVSDAELLEIERALDEIDQLLAGLESDLAQDG